MQVLDFEFSTDGARARIVHEGLRRHEFHRKTFKRNLCPSFAHMPKQITSIEHRLFLLRLCKASKRAAIHCRTTHSIELDGDGGSCILASLIQLHDFRFKSKIYGTNSRYTEKHNDAITLSAV